MTYVSAALREQVIQRADVRCEYCQYPQDAALFAFEMEHVIAEKHGGKTELENLALACPFCNRAKGTDLGSLDPESGMLTAFYNPRKDVWSDHFVLEGPLIRPLTAVGRVTVAILQLNSTDRIAERELLVKLGQFPQFGV